MAELASTELEPADDIGGKDLAHDGSSAGPWGVMEYFVIVQFLSPAILMLPGMQVLRMPIRVLPYAISLALFCFLFQQRSLAGRDSIRVPGSGWLVLVLFLLCAGLFHPDTILKSGVAQLGFQLTILCPIFWTMYARVTVRQVHRIMWLCLACNAIGALMGALQVLWPEHFLPVEFSRNLAFDYLGSLSYEGAGGREIVRPPGLSDVPGGAARGAVTASFFALFFATERHTSRVVKLALVSVLLVSFFTLYLTQVRSSFLVLLGSAAVLAFMRMRRGEGGWSVGVVLLVVGGVALSFSLAVQVGEPLQQLVHGVLPLLEEVGSEGRTEGDGGSRQAATARELRDHHKVVAALACFRRRASQMARLVESAAKELDHVRRALGQCE